MAKGHGGKREGAGRKSRSEEQELIEKLSPHDEKALKALIELIEAKDLRAVQLFFNYRYGKPKERVEHDIPADVVSVPLLNWITNKDDEAKS